MKELKTALHLLLCLSVMLAALFVSPLSALAESAGIGIVTTADDPLNVRSGPGGSYQRIGTVPKGAIVTLLDTSNSQWYHIRYGELEGYASSAYIRIVPEYVPDGDFEEYLTSQGFPESYKPYLRVLHQMYPSWIFAAKKVGLNWNDALNAECEQGRSLTSLPYSIGSELSFEKGAYNWDTGAHVVYDSGGWVMASKELVAYSLDPRNYLNANYVFAFQSMSYSPSETYEGVQNIVKNSFLNGAYPAGLEDSASYATYIDAILAAARESGVSAYHLASYIVQEQGNSGTELSFGTWPGYEGYFNLLNINAYKSGDHSAREMGAMHAKNKGWNTPFKAMLGGGQFIANGYINVGQNNTYLKKFDLIATGGYYNHQYMTNIKAVFTESNKLLSAYDGMLELGYTFEIPVFENMPEQACPKPTSTGSNNNLLKALSVEGQALTPSFERYSYSYSLIVDSSVASVNIVAQAHDDAATVTGAGQRGLVDGNNTFDLTVTAASGTTRTYTLSVYREPGGDTPQPDQPKPPAITGSYTVGTYVTGVAVGTSVEDFILRLGVENASVEVHDSSDNVKSTGVIATGDKVLIYQNGTAVLSYSVVIYGDTNGDGKVASSDLLRGQKHILGINTLSGAQLEACDINHDGRISSVDLLAGQKHILGIKSITQ